MQVKIWTKSNCVQCDMTKRQFAKLGINYVEENIEQNLAQLELFKEKGLMSAPIIETEFGTWSGFKVDKINDLHHIIKSKEGHNG